MLPQYPFSVGSCWPYQGGLLKSWAKHCIVSHRVVGGVSRALAPERRGRASVQSGEKCLLRWFAGNETIALVQTLPWALAEFSGFRGQLRWGCKTSQRSPRVGLDPGDPPSSRPSTSPRPLPESPSSGDRCCPRALHVGRSTGRFSISLGVTA